MSKATNGNRHLFIKHKIRSLREIGRPDFFVIWRVAWSANIRNTFFTKRDDRNAILNRKMLMKAPEITIILFFNRSESKIHSWGFHFGCWRKSVQPVFLRRPFHDQKASVFEEDFHFFFRGFMFK